MKFPARITAATFKSFVRKNREALLVSTKSEHDGMVDGIVYGSGKFRKAEPSELSEKHTLGIRGIWLVGGSRNYFTAYNAEGVVGIEVSNCCGNFIVAIPNPPTP